MKQFSDFIAYSKVFYSHIGSKIFLLILFSFLISTLDILGIALVIPVLEFLLQGDANNTDSQIQKYIRLIIGKDINLSAFNLVLLVLFIFILKGIVTILSHSAIALILSNWLAHFKKKFYKLVTEVDYQYFLSKDTGYFINLTNEQINLSVTSINSYIKLVSNLMSTVMYLLVVFLMAWEPTLLALFGGFTLMLLFNRINKRIAKLSKSKADITGKLSQSLIQIYHSYKYLISTGSLKKTEKTLNAQIEEISGIQFRQNFLSAIFIGIREPFILVVIFLFLGIQVEFLKNSPTIIFASLLLFYRGLISVLGIQQSWQATLSSIGSLMLIDEEVSSLKQKAVLTPEKQLIPQSFDIDFSEVSFKFKQASDPVLNKISFQLRKNKSLAIVGESGAGKSTILNLIANLIKPSNGAIYVGGNDLQETNIQFLRSKIGYVSQEPCIFDETIACNIHMWDEDENEATRQAKVEEAAHKAGLLEFVNSLPSKFETVVGDRGSKLSGGQRQRICVARELYKQPKILILDEATSALDRSIMEEINQNVLSLKNQLSIIFVTHQLSILNEVDEIIILEKGTISDVGSLEALKVRNNSYVLKNHVGNGLSE